MERKSWDEYFLDIAEEVGTRFYLSETACRLCNRKGQAYCFNRL